MIDRLSILWHYLRARRRLAKWDDRAALEAWQEQEVREHIARVATCSPYFRERVAQHGLAGWRRWPVVGKAEMMQHFDAWNTAGIALTEAWSLAMNAERTRDFSTTLNGITVGLSSGTSGHRGIFLASKAERRLWAGTLLARILRGTLGRQHRAALFLRADSPLYRTVGSRHFQFSFFDLYQPLETHWPRLRDLRPTVLAAPPSVLVRLAAHEQAANLLAPPAILLSVADTLDSADRHRIERGFGCKVGQIYQATEGFLAATCPQGQLHWNEDSLVVEKEWLDAEQTRYVPIITDFRRFTQPIVRYRLDDVIVERKAARCPCGSLFGTLGGIDGRCDDVLLLPGQDGSGDVTIFPDFVRRAMVLGTPAGVDYAVAQVSPSRWNISFSQPCPLEPIQREMEELCQRLRARSPSLQIVPWSPPAPPAKVRRVRRQMSESLTS
jgi:putative adenylate-forming enzyme